MKKPYYVANRRKKDGKQSVYVVFNNPVTGKRGAVIAASSLYKAYYAEAMSQQTVDK